MTSGRMNTRAKNVVTDASTRNDRCIGVFATEALGKRLALLFSEA